MEYLQRELNTLAEQPKFKFHPRYKRLGIMHICFADDLLMLCKAKKQSIKLLQVTFQKFSAASRLQANIDKSSIYMTGVKDDLKLDILQTLGFCEGTLPFKYLGVRLSSKKLTIAQCMHQVEKVTERIQCWSAKLLSYAGRLQLIKSVVFGLQTYWAQIFILPKRIMKMSNSLCRTFLLTGTTETSKRALVSWDKVCLPTSAGGLNVLNLGLWNKAAILKQLWALAENKECLWIRILVWLGVHRAIGSWQEEVQWTTTMAKRKSGRGAIISVVFAMVIALVWRYRNLIRFQSHNYNEDRLCKAIAVHLHIRGRTRRKWQPLLSQLNHMP
ncbi:uncharacterized protein LOC132607802 [Lycium barbarum]|uniref:uncharacterized protein LOC132607802 n=1 Tax=Lycium barbarum TaxID=112863 RepID=UPI00293F25A0|nr:uncharacterized protein LOC132607802 [Lycium barbarum]